MKEPGLDERHRDKNGEISKQHGNTLVNTLRKVYGGTFATGKAQTAKLADVLAHLDKSSLSELVKDHEAGRLAKKIKDAE